MNVVNSGEDKRRVRRKPQWERFLLLDGVESATKDTWYPPVVGKFPARWNEPRNRKFHEGFPTSSRVEGKKAWITERMREHRDAILKSVARRDWCRAAVLCGAYLKKGFMKSLTFNVFQDHGSYGMFEGQFPLADVLLVVLDHLPDSRSVIEFLHDALQNDLDYEYGYIKSLYYSALEIANLTMVGDLEAAYQLSEDVVRRWRKPIRFSYFLQLRSVEREDGLIMEFMCDTMIDAGSESQAEFSELKHAALGILRRQYLRKSSLMYYINCHLVFSTGKESQVESVIREGLSKMPRNADLVLLKAAIQMADSRYWNAFPETMLEYVRLNPHQSEAIELMEKAEEEAWDVRMKAIIAHLDVCHPDFKPSDYCCRKWREFLGVLMGGARTGDSEAGPDRYKRIIVDEMESRWDWWKKYFFSRFAVRGMEVLIGAIEVRNLLGVLTQVRAFIYSPDSSFSEAVGRLLSADQLNQVAEVESVVRQSMNFPLADFNL